MRIIEVGTIPTTEIEVKCDRCGTKFAYEKGDLKDAGAYYGNLRV